MNVYEIALAALLLIAASPIAPAQEEEKWRPSLMGSNAEGTHFMVGFMQNEINDPQGYCFMPGAYQSISIGSRYGADVRIIAKGVTYDTTVAAYGVIELVVDSSHECVGEGVFPLGIEIMASRPISVSCFSSKPQTSDGYLALPISAWGTEYVSVNYYLDHYTSLGNPFAFCDSLPRSGEFAVIAAFDSTSVTVVPSTRTVGGRAAGTPYRRLLRKGEILQVQDGGTVRRSGWQPGSDLTGSLVTADKPIGLLSGHMRAGVTTEHESKDHLIEMFPPRTALGRRYMTVPFGDRLGGDVLRVVSSATGETIVRFIDSSGASRPVTLPAIGTFIECDLQTPVEIVADKPVVAVQYARSAGADPRNRDTLTVPFDPDMVVLTPLEQFVDGGIFATPPNYNAVLSRPQFTTHRLTIIGERRGFASIRLNGRSITAIPGVRVGTMPDTGYGWASVEIPAKTTFVLSGDALFTGYLFGLGRFDSYAWPVGSRVRTIIPIEDRRHGWRELDPR